MDHGGIAGQQYYLGLRVIAMGDRNAVDVAQETHEQVLADGGVLASLACSQIRGGHAGRTFV